jgi:ribosomal protein S18 acetylase RimI-like enzyme
MEYKRADQLPFDPRERMSRIFCEGFYDDGLKHFSKDKTKLTKAMSHIFDLSSFYAAAEGNEVMSIVGCTAKKPPPIKLDKKILIQELGFIRGRIAYWGLNKFIVDKPYPFEMTPQTGSIEFVAAAPEHKGKVATYGLLSYVTEMLPFSEYVLEVRDDNTPAIRLYEKLGFSEFMRVTAPKGSGIKEFVYMSKGEKEMYGYYYDPETQKFTDKLDFHFTTSSVVMEYTGAMISEPEITRNIRKCRGEDYARCSHIWNIGMHEMRVRAGYPDSKLYEPTEEDRQDFMDNLDNNFALEYDGKIIGYGAITEDNGIGALAVDTHFSGRGYGTALAIFMTNEILRRGYGIVYSECEGKNFSSRRVHEKIGYKITNTSYTSFKKLQ